MLSYLLYYFTHVSGPTHSTDLPKLAVIKNWKINKYLLWKWIHTLQVLNEVDICEVNMVAGTKGVSISAKNTLKQVRDCASLQTNALTNLHTHLAQKQLIKLAKTHFKLSSIHSKSDNKTHLHETKEVFNFCTVYSAFLWAFSPFIATRMLDHTSV